MTGEEYSEVCRRIRNGATIQICADLFGLKYQTFVSRVRAYETTNNITPSIIKRAAGRPKANKDEEIEKLFESGRSGDEIAKLLGISRSTVFARLKEIKPKPLKLEVEEGVFLCIEDQIESVTKRIETIEQELLILIDQKESWERILNVCEVKGDKHGD